MLDTDRYAGKKRKKPAPKHKPSPDATKSNPSKRHRDRLNSELDRLTNMLPFPENVCSRLDKLSVLRLSVGYLKVKSFFNAIMKQNSLEFHAGNGLENTSMNMGFSEGDLLLQALNGFVLVVTAEGYVFYASPTTQDYLGFHQSDMVHQSVFEFIHVDDRAMFRRQLHFALDPTLLDVDKGCAETQSSSDITRNIVTYDPQHVPPENSSFLERSFICRFRCLLDNSSGFLKLNFQGRLKFLHGQRKKAENGSLVQPQLALFAIATPVQPPAIVEIRTKTLIFQTKHKLDFTPIGIDSRGKIVLGYTEMELCMRGSGYQFIHAADMMHCADNHIRMIKTGESGMTVFRLLTKNGGWVWVQANARLIYKGGRPDFIIARQRALVNAEGEEHLRQRKLQLPFNFATGEAVLYDTWPTFDTENPHCNKDSSVQNATGQASLHPSSLLALMQNQDKSIYTEQMKPQFNVDEAFRDSWALFKVPNHAMQDKATKEEDTVVDQIVHDGDFSLGLQQMQMEVEKTELNDWENALLRLTKDSNGKDRGFSLDEILTNDIFSYVEEVLQKENNHFPLFQPNTKLSVKPEPLGAPTWKFSSATSLSGCANRDHSLDSSGTARMNQNTERKLNLGDFSSTPASTYVDMGIQSCILNRTEDASLLNNSAPKEFIFPTHIQSSVNTKSSSPALNGWTPKVCENGRNSSELQSPTVPSSQFWSSPVPHNRYHKLSQPTASHGNKRFSGTEVQNRNPMSSPKNSVSPDIISCCPTFSQQNQMQTSQQWQNPLPTQLCKSPVTSTIESLSSYLSGPYADLSENSWSYNEKSNNLANSVYHSPLNGLTADQCSPLSNFVIESHSPGSTNTVQHHPQTQLTHSPERHSLTKPILQKSPQEASCFFQWMPNEPMPGSTLVPQEDVCISPPCQVASGVSSHRVLQRYLSCNGHIQVETRPVEENSTFFCPPLVGGLYNSENCKTSCFSLPIHVSNISGHQGLD